jgi:hypothetical protein
VRVLLDENLPHDLVAGLVGHSVSTVQGLGWAGTKNGDLLKRASGVSDAFVTMDGKLEHQHISPFFGLASWLLVLDPIACQTGSTGQGRARWSRRETWRPH